MAATIGPEGGVISSADGRVELRFPAGALTAPTEISIQPVTNTAHGGIGDGYDFLPDGATFAAPVEVVLHYADADLEGTAAAFVYWAFQDDERLWQVLETTADLDARTVTATTTHFTRFSAISELRITPTSAEVEVDGAIAIEVHYCAEIGMRVGTETVFAFQCRLANGAFLNTRIGTWMVNGIAGGNGTVGLIGGTFRERASYEAPSEVPSPDTVEVSIDAYDVAGHSAGDLVAHVRILPRGRPYRGDVTFAQPDANVTGTAHLVWAPASESADVLRFSATGTLDGHVTYADCDPADVTLPIVGGELVVYTSANVAFPNQHQFTVSAMGEVTLNCGSPRRAITMPLVVTVVGGVCTGPPFAPFDDVELLSGSGACEAAGLTSLDWSFRRDSAR